MADVLNIPIRVVGSEQACALGAAIFGAVSAGRYNSVSEAMEKMGSPTEVTYEPNNQNVLAYEKVYERYNSLCETMEIHIMNQVRTNG